MTQVYIGIDTKLDDIYSVELRDKLFNAASSVGLDTSFSSHNSNITGDCIGCSSDKRETFKLDISRLLQAQCAILELTNPSLGIGFSAGYLFCDRPKIPVLGLISEPADGRDIIINPGSFITGCPQIQIRKYNPNIAKYELPRIIHDWLVGVGLYVPRPTSGPVILITGPPGAGKTTQAHLLSQHLGIPHISNNEIIEHLPRTHRFYSSVAPYLNTGVVVPPPIMKHLILERLTHPSCRSGYILDGYPESIDDCQTLKELGVQPTLIIQLWASKQCCVSRILKKNESANDASSAANRLENYITRFPSLNQMGDALGPAMEFEILFPNCHQAKYFKDDDYEAPPEKVMESILGQVNFEFTLPLFSIAGRDFISTETRIHFHIKSAGQNLNIDLAKIVEQPCKVRPIVKTITIKNPEPGNPQIVDPGYINEPESSVIGILTEDTIPEYVKFLEALSKMRSGDRYNKPVITSVSEYLWKQTQYFTPDKKPNGTKIVEYAFKKWTGWSSLSYETRGLMGNQKYLKPVMNETYQIQHIINIPKLSVPNLDEITDWVNVYCQSMDLFQATIYQQPGFWNIQYSRFYDGTYDECKAYVLAQQRQISDIIHWPVNEIESSIELVHGVWKND